jgi:peptide/nickel transport system ATP-binding protein
MADYIENYTGTVTLDNELISTKDYYPVQLIFQHPEKTMNPKWKMHKVLEESWNPPQELMDTFGLKDNWMGRWPNELSGGELQRFSILRALNPKTKFIIADEISTMLDAVTQVQIWDALLDYCKQNKIGILAVSHDKDLLEVISDDIILFNDINKL